MKLKSKDKKKVFRIGIIAGTKRKQPRKTMKQSVPFVQTSEDSYYVQGKGMFRARTVRGSDATKMRNLSLVGYAFNDDGREYAILKDSKNKHIAVYSHDPTWE